MRFQLTLKDIYLAAAFAVGGFIFYQKSFLLYLSGLTPLQGLFVYYAVLGTFVFALQYFKLLSAGLHNAIGVLMLFFAVALIANWTNPYVQFVTTGNVAGASPVFYQAEDGVVWDFWYNTVGIKDFETAKYLSFVLTP